MQGISNTGSNQEPWWRGMSGNTGTGMSGMNSNTGMSMMNQLSNTGLGINTNNSQQIGLTDRAGINKEPQVTVIAPSGINLEICFKSHLVINMLMTCRNDLYYFLCAEMC